MERTRSTRKRPQASTNFSNKWLTVQAVTLAGWGTTTRFVVVTLAMQAPVDVLTFLLTRH